MAGFGLPNFGQLTEAFKKAQEIQQNAQALQDELDGMEIEGKSSDGRASVWLSGNQQPLRVRLDPALLQEGQQHVVPQAPLLEFQPQKPQHPPDQGRPPSRTRAARQPWQVAPQCWSSLRPGSHDTRQSMEYVSGGVSSK